MTPTALANRARLNARNAAMGLPPDFNGYRRSWNSPR